jgi:hypothetical protein
MIPTLNTEEPRENCLTWKPFCLRAQPPRRYKPQWDAAAWRMMESDSRVPLWIGRSCLLQIPAVTDTKASQFSPLWFFGTGERRTSVRRLCQGRRTPQIMKDLIAGVVFHDQNGSHQDNSRTCQRQRPQSLT